MTPKVPSNHHSMILSLLYGWCPLHAPLPSVCNALFSSSGCEVISTIHSHYSPCLYLSDSQTPHIWFPYARPFWTFTLEPESGTVRSVVRQKLGNPLKQQGWLTRFCNSWNDTQNSDLWLPKVKRTLLATLLNAYCPDLWAISNPLFRPL